MPSVNSDLKELMCYQINKFERTVNSPIPAIPAQDDSSIDAIEPCSKTSIESGSNSEIPLYQNALASSNSIVPKICSDNYENLPCNCINNESNNNVTSSKIDQQSRQQSFHYCPEHESQVKRSRSIRFGSGGEVIIDKNHGYANTRWLENSPSSSSIELCPPLPLRETSNKIRRPFSTIIPVSSTAIIPTRTTNSSENKTSISNNLTVNLNLPESIDLDTFFKTHSLSISINVSEKRLNSKTSSSLIKYPLSRKASDSFNQSLLQESGWYYQNVDWQESILMLRSTALGTFILRDSGDSRYSFSLSVQTSQGPISARISYTNGKYRLDSQMSYIEKMPSFSTVIALIEHYAKNGLVKTSRGRQVWIDSTGQICSPVQLGKPKLKEPRTLKHLARLVLNGYSSQQKHVQQSIPASVASYLAEYPYTI